MSTSRDNRAVVVHPAEDSSMRYQSTRSGAEDQGRSSQVQRRRLEIIELQRDSAMSALLDLEALITSALVRNEACTKLEARYGNGSTDTNNSVSPPNKRVGTSWPSTCPQSQAHTEMTGSKKNKNWNRKISGMTGL